MDKFDKSFIPTTDWVSQKYDEMNKLLFKGELGPCDFGLFTTGKGSQGNRLGYFKMMRPGLKYDRSRRIYYNLSMFTNDKEYANSKNFAEVCLPKIFINANYNGTEDAFLHILVHEMCHYYCEKDGYYPKQHHGTDFRYVCSLVESRSNGRFKIQRVMDAELFNQMELCPEMQAKADARKQNKLSNSTAMLFFLKDGEVKLFRTWTKNIGLMRNALEYLTKRYPTYQVLSSNDEQVIALLTELGYRSNSREINWWKLKGDNQEKIKDCFANSNHDEVYSNQDISEQRLSRIIKEEINKLLSSQITIEDGQLPLN